MRRCEPTSGRHPRQLRPWFVASQLNTRVHPFSSSRWLLGITAGGALGLMLALLAPSEADAGDQCPSGCDPGRVCFEQSCVPAPMRCSAHCEQRDADGKCSQYSQDECGPAMVCAAQCTGRTSGGRCRSWDADMCGPEMACVPRCVAREPGGRCEQYDEDLCGPRASCAPNCIDRDAKGSCRKYDADACAVAE